MFKLVSFITLISMFTLSGCQVGSGGAISTPTPLPTPIITATPSPTGPVSSPSPEPSLPTPPSPDANPSPSNNKITSFQLSNTTLCYGQNYQITGVNYMSGEVTNFVFRHPITRDRDENENPEIYLVKENVTANGQGEISETFTLNKTYKSGLNGEQVSLLPGKYVTLLEKPNREWDNIVQVEVKECDS